MVDRLLAHPRGLLTQVLVLNMVANIGYFVVTSVMTMHADSIGWQVGISLGSLFVIVLVGEVLAKLLAAGATVRFLMFAAPVHMIIVRVFHGPLQIFDSWVIGPLTRLASPSAHPDAATVTTEEMGALIELSKGEGVIGAGEEELFQAIISLSEQRAEQVMVPRVDITWVDIGSTREQMLELYEKTGRSRYPVCRGSLDAGVIGLVDARRVLEGAKIADAMIEPIFVPEQIRLDQLIDAIRGVQFQQAICVDEHGGVAGLVTLTDVIDELLRGYAEPDVDPSQTLEMVRPGCWVIPGRLGIRDWVAYLPGEAEFAHTKQANTIGGLVMVLLGRVPHEGDTVRFGGATLRVIEMHGRSVQSVEVMMPEATKDPQHDGGAS